MAKTRSAQVQTSIFSCFKSKKSQSIPILKAMKPAEAKTAASHKNSKICRFQKKPKNQILTSKIEFNQIATSCQTRRSSQESSHKRTRKGQRKQTEARKQDVSPFRMSNVDFALSNRETEAPSEFFVDTTQKAVFRKDIESGFLSQIVVKVQPERKRRSSRQSSKTANQKRRKTSKGSLKRVKYAKSENIRFKTNESTLSLNSSHVESQFCSQGGIPHTQKFRCYKVAGRTQIKVRILENSDRQTTLKPIT